MYGLLWLGAAVVQIRGWDMRVIGNLALLCLVLQLVHMALLASYRAEAGMSTLHFVLVEAVLASYVLVLYGFWGATHGRLKPRVTGWLCMLASLGTLYILVYGGGLLAPPGA
jgi:hypothetical protein